MVRALRDASVLRAVVHRVHDKDAMVAVALVLSHIEEEVVVPCVPAVDLLRAGARAARHHQIAPHHAVAPPVADRVQEAILHFGVHGAVRPAVSLPGVALCLQGRPDQHKKTVEDRSFV